MAEKTLSEYPDILDAGFPEALSDYPDVRAGGELPPPVDYPDIGDYPDVEFQGPGPAPLTGVNVPATDVSEFEALTTGLSEDFEAEIEARVAQMIESARARQEEIEAGRHLGPVPESPALRIGSGVGAPAGPPPKYGGFFTGEVAPESPEELEARLGYDPMAEAWDAGPLLSSKTPQQTVLQSRRVRAAGMDDPEEKRKYKEETAELVEDIRTQRMIRDADEWQRLRELGMSASEEQAIVGLVEDMGPAALQEWENWDLPEDHPDRVSSPAAMMRKAYRDGLEREGLIEELRIREERYTELTEGPREGWLDLETEEGVGRVSELVTQMHRAAKTHESRTDIVLKKEDEYQVAKKLLSNTKEISELLGMPEEQVEAIGLAQFVTKYAHAQMPDPEIYNLIAQGYTPPMAGELTPGWEKATVAEKVLSWFSRPFYSTVSVSADLDYFFQMKSQERQDWADKLHPGDPRKPIFLEIGGVRYDKDGERVLSIIDEQNRIEGLYDADVHGRLKGLKWQLRRAYWDANALDPYGFNIYLPHPWQKIEKGGIIAEGERLTGPHEIRSRGLAAQVVGSPIKTDDPAMMAHISKEEQRWMSHVDAQWWGLGTAIGIDNKYYKGPPDPLASLFIPKLKRQDILKQIEEGDPLAGMWTANMFQIIAPDLAAPYGGVLAATGKLLGAPGKIKAGGSFFTLHGDRMRTAQQARQGQKVAAEMERRALAAGREVSQDGKDKAVALIFDGMDSVYNDVAALGSVGAKYTPENAGRAREIKKTLRGPNDPAWLEVKHIDFDEAIYFDEGLPNFDSTKVRVTYGDDPIPSVGAVVDRIAAAGKGSPGAEAVRDFLYGKGAARKVRQRRGLIPEEAPTMVIPEGEAATAARLQGQLDAEKARLAPMEAGAGRRAGEAPRLHKKRVAAQAKKVRDLEKRIERLKVPKELTPDEVVDHMLAEMFDPLRPSGMFPKRTSGNVFKVFDGAGRMAAQVSHAIFPQRGARPFTDVIQRAFGVDSTVLGWSINHGTKEAPNWRPAKLIDMITEQEAQRVVQGHWKRDVTRRALGAQFHKLAYDVMVAKDGSEEAAEAMGRFVEALGEPVDMADVGMSVLQGVTNHVSRGIQYRPVARTAARADIPPLPPGGLSKKVAEHMIARNKGELTALRDLNIPAAEGFLEHGLTFNRTGKGSLFQTVKRLTGVKPFNASQLKKALEDLVERGIVTKTDDGKGFRIKPEYYELPGKPKVERPPTPAAAPAAATDTASLLAKEGRYLYPNGDTSLPPVHPVEIGGRTRYVTSVDVQDFGKVWYEFTDGRTVDPIFEGKVWASKKKDLVTKLEAAPPPAAAAPPPAAAAPVAPTASPARVNRVIEAAYEEYQIKMRAWRETGEGRPGGVVPAARPPEPSLTATEIARRMFGGFDDPVHGSGVGGELGELVEDWVSKVAEAKKYHKDPRFRAAYKSSKRTADKAWGKVVRRLEKSLEEDVARGNIGSTQGPTGTAKSKRLYEPFNPEHHQHLVTKPAAAPEVAAAVPPVTPPVSAAGVIEGIAKKPKLKPRPTAAKLRKMRGKLSRYRPSLEEGRQFDRPGIRDTRGADLERVPGPDILERPVLGMIDAEVGRAQIIRQTVRELLGVADADELRALRSLHDNIDGVITKATKALDPTSVDDYLEALEGMSLADVRQSARALRRPTFDPAEYKNLSPAQKTAVQAVRDMQKMAFELLKAEGLLPKGRSLAWWYEKMQVEGYTHQMMTTGGFRKFSKLMTGKDPRTAAPLLKRTEKGILLEKERRTQLGMAEMLWRERNPNFELRVKAQAEQIWRQRNPGLAGQVPPGDELKKIIRENSLDIPPEGELLHLAQEEGLDKIRYYEHQLHIRFKHYGDAISAGIAMQRFGRDMAKQFPKGDTFVGMLRGGQWKTLRNAAGEMPKTPGEAKRIVELEAARAGYRKVDSVSYVRGVFEANAWEGWRTYEAQVTTLLNNSLPETAADDVMGFFREKGIDVSDPLVDMQARVLANELYLPDEVATFIEHMNKPDWLSDWRRGGIAQELIGGTFHDTLNFFKAAVTVSAIAFHGRNALSNIASTYLAHGISAINPVRQMEMMWLLVAPDDITKLEIKLGRKAGPRTFALNINDPVTGLKSKEIRTIREWKEKMRNVGVLMDDWNPSDIRLGFKRMKTGWVSPGYRSDEMRRAAEKLGFAQPAARPGAPLVTTGIGAAVGGTVGYNMGPDDTPEGRKLVQAFAGILTGGIGGAAPGAIYDLYMKEPLKAARGAFKPGQDLAGVVRANPGMWSNTKTAISAALDVWLDSITAGGKPLSSVSRTERLARGITGSPATKVGLATGLVGGVFGALTPLTEDESRPERLVRNMVYGFLGGAGAAVAANAAFVVHAGVGVKIEEQAKAVGWFAGKAKGLSDDAAREIVDATIFNYFKLTPFEKYGMRRFFPFYTWTSKNIRLLQPYLLANEPKRYAAFQHVLMMGERGFAEKDDILFTPEHLQFTLAANMGKGRIIARYGLPEEDVISMFRPGDILSRAHPGIQILSRFFGHEMYYNTPTKFIRSGRDVLYLPAPFREFVGLAEVPTYRRDEEGNKIQTGTKWEVGHFTNKDGSPSQSITLGTYRMSMLKSFPMWRLVTEYNKMITERYLLGTTGLTGVDPVPISWGTRVLPVFTGIKIYDLNEDQERRNFWRGYNEALWDAMDDMDQTGIRRYLKKNTELTQSDIDGLLMYRESEQAQQGLLDQIITTEDVGAVGKEGAMAPDMGFPVGVPSPAMPEE